MVSWRRWRRCWQYRENNLHHGLCCHVEVGPCHGTITENSIQSDYLIYCIRIDWRHVVVMPRRIFMQNPEQLWRRPLNSYFRQVQPRNMMMRCVAQPKFDRLERHRFVSCYVLLASSPSSDPAHSCSNLVNCCSIASHQHKPHVVWLTYLDFWHWESSVKH